MRKQSKKSTQSLQTWPRMASLRQGNVLVSLPYTWAAQVISLRQVIMGAYNNKESESTERLCFHFSLSCTGEGNGSPLQCSCLENPRDGGAWWASIYGVAQSRTRLKRLSSSSSNGVSRCIVWNSGSEIKFFGFKSQP